MESKMISLDNGHSYTTAADAMAEIEERGLWDALANLMDDDAREQTANELSPCSKEAFLARYLELAPCDLILG